MEIKLGKGEIIDLADPGLTRQDLLNLKLEIEREKDSIQAQLNAAREKAAETGAYADRSWWNRANYAKLCMGRNVQAIQHELGRRSREAKADGRAWRDHFFDVVQDRMGREIFMEYVEEAKARWEAAKEA